HRSLALRPLRVFTRLGTRLDLRGDLRRRDADDRGRLRDRRIHLSQPQRDISPEADPLSEGHLAALNTAAADGPVAIFVARYAIVHCLSAPSAVRPTGGPGLRKPHGVRRSAPSCRAFTPNTPLPRTARRLSAVEANSKRSRVFFRLGARCRSQSRARVSASCRRGGGEA